MLAGALTLLERKRLEMARALATGPKLLLLDEIAGGLTEPECHELVAAIGDLRGRASRSSGSSTSSTRCWPWSIAWSVIDFGKKIAEGEPHAVMASREVAEIYLGLEARCLTRSSRSSRPRAPGYGDFQALFDVGLEVGPGEVLAMIGANGAGKIDAS